MEGGFVGRVGRGWIGMVGWWGWNEGIWDGEEVLSG